MEKLAVCPVCGSNESYDLFSCVDYVASHESFAIQECRSCSLKYTNPRPAENEIGRYYQSDRYISHSGSQKANLGLTYKLYDIVRNYTIRWKLKVLKQYHQGGRLLDLGCGLGYFLNGVKKDGIFNADGADVSDEAIQFVKETFGYPVMQESELKNVANDSYELITQWHVLEHVHRLQERMQELKRILAPNGTMFLAVPNSASFDAGKYEKYWDGYDVPRHLYHFTPKSFIHLMEANGFKVVEQRPMWFDAPYISMRSEYHQKNSLGFLKGGFTGLYSNLKASQSGNYSSLLFIVKHA